MGETFAALKAGIIPNTVPKNSANKVPNPIDFIPRFKGTICCVSTGPKVIIGRIASVKGVLKRRAIPIPIIEPIKVKMRDSAMKCAMIPPLVLPIARLKPTSRVRSSMLTSIMLKIPKELTKRAIIPNAPKNNEAVVTVDFKLSRIVIREVPPVGLPCHSVTGSFSSTKLPIMDSIFGLAFS